MASWIAAATSYSTSNAPMIPFYIYYSMFGFQRVGDLAWAAGDMRARGFLLGGTVGPHHAERRGPAARGRPQPHLSRRTIPNCVSYDPTFAYEVAVIIQDGLRRMYAEQEDVFYYITRDERELRAPRDAGGRGGGHHQGHVPAPRRGRGQGEGRARAAAGLRHDPARGRSPAAELLERRLRRQRRHLERARASPSCAARRMDVERWNMLHPAETPRRSYVETAASSGRRRPGDRRDRLHAGCSPTRSAPSCRRRYRVLGTDGFGRSDYRKRAAPTSSRSTGTSCAVAALKALADEKARARRPRSSPRRSGSTASIPRSPTRRRSDAPTDYARERAVTPRDRRTGSVDWPIEVKVPDIGDFKDIPVIEIS